MDLSNFLSATEFPNFKIPTNKKRKIENETQKQLCFIPTIDEFKEFERPFKLKPILDEEPIYLPFFKQIDPRISKVNVL